MNAPIFLSLEQIEDIHRASIDAFGGTLGIRDRSALESAVFHPQAVFHYRSGDVFDVAAAYAYHLAEAQAYLDGNKRTAIAAALVFLAVNGISIQVDSMPLYNVMIAIAERRATKDDLAAALRDLMA